MAVTLKDTGLKDMWTWKNFKPEEIACPCCGELSPTDELSPFFIESMDKIQALRELLGHQVVLTSAHRCGKHNAEVGGEVKSLHLQIAFDISQMKKDQFELIKALDEVGFTGIGLYNGFIHADLGRKRWWNHTTVKNAYDLKIVDFLIKRGK